MFSKTLCLILAATLVQSYVPANVREDSLTESSASHLDELKKLVESEVKAKVADIIQLVKDITAFEEHVQEEAISEIAEIEEGADEEIRELTDENSPFKDPKSCVVFGNVNRVEQLSGLTNNTFDKLENCTAERVSEAVSILQLGEQKVREVVKISDALAAELNKCGSDNKCKENVDKKIMVAIIELPSNTTKIVQDLSVLMHDINTSIRDCGDQYVEYYDSEEGKILAQIEECLEDKEDK